MHLFLSGVPGVGKSTLIRAILAAYPGLSVGGLCSYTAADVENATGSVYLSPYGGQKIRDEEHRVGIRLGKGRILSYPEVFERAGMEILNNRAGCELIVLDEIGRMENQAENFCRELLSILDEPVPVLGVIKPFSTPLMDSIRAHKRVEEWIVTESNRDALVKKGQDWLKNELRKKGE